MSQIFDLSSMRLKSVIRVGCFVGVLVFCRAGAAGTSPALIGATRDKVVSRLGDPAGDIVAGDREVLVYADLRVVLNAGYVTAVEAILPEPTPPAPVDATTAQPPSDAASGNATVAPVASAPTPNPSAPATTSASPPETVGAAPAAAAKTAPKDQEAVIKSVRPPSSLDRRAAARARAPAASLPSTTQVAVSRSTSAPPLPARAAQPAVATAPATTARPQPALDSSAPAATATPQPVPATAAGASAVTGDVTPSAPPAAPRPRPGPHVEQAPNIPSATENIFTTRTYLIAGVIIIGGLAYLVWRRRNRRLMLAATAVSNSPFPVQPMFISGARFTPELLGKLEWQRFEELVAAYYNKTGVVATRTKSGPSAPVHVRISWKGESRPFALVQCLAQPAGLIDAKPVQALCDVLAAEDIRRGYIVTSGKFGIAARDLAEEKHVTLLSGDIFLEKLNALPDPVRAELMHDMTRGDYTTPTCPKCDVKMVHPAGDPDGWQCPQCGAALPAS